MSILSEPIPTIFVSTDQSHSYILSSTSPVDSVSPVSPSSPYSPYSSSSSDISYISSSSDVSSYFSEFSDEDLTVPMDQLNQVKKLLGMIPPPMTAEQFIHKNSFKAADGHIKRPSNNFILFRKIAHDRKGQTPELSKYNEREFSKLIGKIWKNLNKDEKLSYETLGKEVSELHKTMYPEYKYQPKRDKAAWKHFNPEANNSTQRRRKTKVKQQKQQETIEPMQDLPRLNISNVDYNNNIQSNPEIISTINTINDVNVDINQMNFYSYDTTVNDNNSLFNMFNYDLNAESFPSMQLYQ